MKEVEILVRVLDDKNIVLSSLRKFEFKGSKETRDIYFFDELRDNLKIVTGNYPREWFRIRLKDGQAYITYKKDVFEDNIWSHSDEYESKVGDFNILKQIIEQLGYKELIEINSVKHTYETKDYEIVFEEVKDLGLFLEVERLNVGDEDNVQDVKNQIQEFINQLGFKVSSELNFGKPELMLKSKFGG